MGLDFIPGRPYVLFMGENKSTALTVQTAKQKHPTVKVVNGVKLHPTYNREGQLIYVTIPE